MLPAFAVQSDPQGTWREDELTVVELVNQQRAHLQLPPLLPDDRLHAAAKAHSDDMAERNYFDHTSPAPESWTFQDRISAAGYHWDRPGGAAAENISSGVGRYQDAHSVVFGTALIDDLLDFAAQRGLPVAGEDWEAIGAGWRADDWQDWAGWQKERNQPTGWMGSEGHRSNVLDGRFAHIGVGYAVTRRDRHYHHYWTVTFASGGSDGRISREINNLVTPP
jgi:uncharacterized protein YkwD